MLRYCVLSFCMPESSVWSFQVSGFSSESGEGHCRAGVGMSETFRSRAAIVAPQASAACKACWTLNPKRVRAKEHDTFRAGPTSLDLTPQQSVMMYLRVPSTSLEIRDPHAAVSRGCFRGGTCCHVAHPPTKELFWGIEPTAPKQAAIWYLPCCCSAPCWSRCLKDLCSRLASFMQAYCAKERPMSWTGLRKPGPGNQELSAKNQVLVAAPCQHKPEPEPNPKPRRACLLLAFALPGTCQWSAEVGIRPSPRSPPKKHGLRSRNSDTARRKSTD